MHCNSLYLTGCLKAYGLYHTGCLNVCIADGFYRTGCLNVGIADGLYHTGCLNACIAVVCFIQGVSMHALQSRIIIELEYQELTKLWIRWSID